MARTNFRSIDEYIAAQPRAAQPVLRRVRGAIRRALPEAEEVISYRIPAFRLDGPIVIYFAAWREHYSLYPSSDRLVATFERELAGCEIGKGTIRFPLGRPVPVKLIEDIARFRAKEVAERRKAR